MYESVRIVHPGASIRRGLVIITAEQMSTQYYVTQFSRAILMSKLPLKPYNFPFFILSYKRSRVVATFKLTLQVYSS